MTTMAKPTVKTDKTEKPADGGWRETVESIAMAVILALLFRGFVAEAFVIPTGSMAPTLQGRHKDVWCPKCNFQYQASASDERDSMTDRPNGNHVVGTMCPMCRYPQLLDLFGDPNDGSMSGDRIIVGKFSYDLAEPQRWDVIVFKFPGNAVQNYIKRLIGLPNERVLIAGGNIYTAGLDEPDEALQIARKPPHKLEALLQLVDDTDYIPADLVQIGWPSRWQEMSAGAWKAEEGGKAFVIAGENEEDAILRYRHLHPSIDDWREITARQQLPASASERAGRLITDFYAYNTFFSVEQRRGTPIANSLTPQNYDPRTYDPEKVEAPGPGTSPERQGLHWVDDLAVECLAEIDGNAGEVILQAVRAGVTYECRIDVATGQATLTCQGASGETHEFESDDGANQAPKVTATTAVTGPGKYRLKLSNCDHEILLWVNGSVVKFDGPTTYPSPLIVRPFWSPENPGDLAPLGIGTRGVAARLSQLRVYRDKYYIATNTQIFSDYLSGKSAEEIQDVFADPTQWETSNLFDEGNRKKLELRLQKDQFLPMGDNSPASFDGRFWYDALTGEPHTYVERDLLIGKALMIYWPHTWNRPVPYFPNFRKMQLIR
jgi:signal peptidase I